MTTDTLHRPMFIEEFEPLVGQIFEADCTPKVAQLKLVSVLPSRFPAGPLRKPFTLIFHSSPAVMLVGALYKMRCPGLEPAMIYIEPTAPPAAGAAAGHYYQAVFN